MGQIIPAMSFRGLSNDVHRNLRSDWAEPPLGCGFTKGVAQGTILRRIVTPATPLVNPHSEGGSTQSDLRLLGDEASTSAVRLGGAALRMWIYQSNRQGNDSA